MQIKKTMTVLLSVIFSLCLGSTVFATEYLFKLKQDAVALCSDDAFLMSEECFEDDSLLAQKFGVYTTDDISVIEKYQMLGLVEYYEENAPAYLFDMPSTTEYMSKPVYGYAPIGESLAQLNVDSFWKLGLNGKGITVGVIDSGANAHNDLAANILPGYNTYDVNYVYSDGVGHGTMVAGLIAANGTSYKGAAYNAKIIPIKAFNDSGKGSTGTMANGILKAIELGCDMINMSCGSLYGSLDRNTPDTLRDAVDYAIKNGVIIISASGNVSSSAYGTKTVGTYDSLMYPACYDGVVSVGNIDISGNLSNTSMENDYVDVVAHGKYVTGLLNTDVSRYKGSSGTSFASPLVAGIVACMLQAKPNLTPAEIETMLQETATDLGNPGKDFSYGYGKVNCAAIVSGFFDGMIYRSNIVEYNGTYNIAFRNGFNTSKKITVSQKESSEADEIKSKYSLEYGETLNFEVPMNGFFKTLYEQASDYKMYIRNGTGKDYTSMVVSANFDGIRMSGIGSTIVNAPGNGQTTLQTIPGYTSGITKIFELDALTLSPIG